ncbi:MAG TPA: MarR family transcriptional regulator [Bacillales bacterium]|nr:MarR family transcriptional regulator [Bacillales bacterium]
MGSQRILGESDLALKLLVVLSRANRAVTDKIKEDIKSHGLNPTEFGVLELLFHKGDQPIQQIGEKVLLSSGSMTYVIDKLEEKKFLRRTPCPNDRRITYATITEEGVTLMEDIFPKHREAIRSMFSGLDSGEQQMMIELLKKLGFSLEKE